MTYIIYHAADLDGICSAALLHLRYPDAKLLPGDYGLDPLDGVTMTKNDIVLIVDFCLTPFSRMIELAGIVGARRLIWIDHHASAIKDYQEAGYPSSIEDHLSTAYAGCELTWAWLNRKDPGQAIDAVRLLGLWDRWAHDLDPRTVPFQYGMKAKNLTPTSQEWEYFLDPLNHYTSDHVDQVLVSGRSIQGYARAVNANTCGRISYPVRFEGQTWLAANIAGSNSSFFDGYFDPEIHAGMIPWYYSGATKLWTFSLYSTPETGVDCSIIAKKYGGGGHKCAAGFQVKNISEINMEELTDESST